jgi:hypothetical protein
MKYALVLALLVCLFGGTACTNLNQTQQGTVSGGLIGVAGGLGLAVISGGASTIGTLVGGGVGALTGGYLGYQESGEPLF